MKATVNDHFKQNKAKIFLFGLFTACVSLFAPLKSFQLKWLIDSTSKEEAFCYLGLVFVITFLSWMFERLSRRSFTKLACGAVEQVRNQVMERILHRPVAQYNREGDAAYLSLLTTDLRTLYDDYYMSIFNVVFWGGIMLCALGLYLYISPVLLVVILLITVPPLVLPRMMNERLKQTRDRFSSEMAMYTGQLKELLGGFELIRSFLRENAYCSATRFLRNSDRIIEKKQRRSKKKILGSSHSKRGPLQGGLRVLRDEPLWLPGKDANCLYLGVFASPLISFVGSFFLSSQILSNRNDIGFGKLLDLALAILDENGIDGDHIGLNLHFCLPPFSSISTRVFSSALDCSSAASSSKSPAIAS